MNQNKQPIDSKTIVNSNQSSIQNRLAKFQKLTFRLLKGGLYLAIAYVVFILIGLIPVNNDFQPTSDGVPVLVISNLVHTDLILPVSNDIIDWRELFPADYFPTNIHSFSHISFGWGDEGFFIQTPEWSDLKLSTATNALLMPSSTCMHVTYLDGDLYQQLGQTVMISPQQYQKLVDQIQASFQSDDQGALILLDGNYGWYDAFFRAKGNYHIFNTCNSWAGRVLQTAEVRTPWYSPLPKTVFLWLPK